MVCLLALGSQNQVARLVGKVTPISLQGTSASSVCLYQSSVLSILVTPASLGCAYITVLAVLFRCTPCSVDHVCIGGRFTWFRMLCGLDRCPALVLICFIQNQIRYRCYKREILWVHIQCRFACISCDGRIHGTCYTAVKITVMLGEVPPKVQSWRPGLYLYMCVSGCIRTISRPSRAVQVHSGKYTVCVGNPPRM